MSFFHGIYFVSIIKLSNIISVYRLNSRIGNPSMQAIQEENQVEDEHEQEIQTQRGKKS